MSINTRRADAFNLRPEAARHNSLEMLATQRADATRRDASEQARKIEQAE